MHTDASKIASQPAPAVAIAAIFNKTQFDNELAKDLPPLMTKVAGRPLAVLAEHYGKSSINSTPVTSNANAMATALVTGGGQLGSVNGAIANQLQSKIDLATRDGLTTGALLASFGVSLGVSTDDDGNADDDQPIGDAAQNLSESTSHSLIMGVVLAVMATQNGQKSWVSMEDDKVRPTHQQADADYANNPIPSNQPFIVGGSEMMYPGDPSGPPGEVINCRCILVPA